MIETDAYCAWRHFHPDGANDEHAHFTEELAQQLLTNTFDDVGTEGVLAWKTQFWMYM